MHQTINESIGWGRRTPKSERGEKRTRIGGDKGQRVRGEEARSVKRTRAMLGEEERKKSK